MNKIQNLEFESSYNKLKFIMRNSLKAYTLDIHLTSLARLKWTINNRESDIFWKHLFIYLNNNIDLDMNKVIADFLYLFNPNNEIFDKYRKYKDINLINIKEFINWIEKNDLKLLKMNLEL